MRDSNRSASAYTFVTVAHHDDYGLMRLQARSLARYMERALAAEILVVENPQPGRPVGWRETLTEEYGDLSPRVRFLDAREVADIPLGMSGWFSQQVLKLTVARLVSTDRYVVLDGKNHLVHPLSRSDVEAPSGKPRSFLMSFRDHPMRPFFENTLAYFGLDPHGHLDGFTPTTTPFTLPSQRVRDLVEWIESREGRTFAEAFVWDGYKRSEFFLFAAYLLSKGERLSDLYEFSAAPSPAIWPESTGAESIAAIAKCEREQSPFFAVHRRAFPSLDAETRGAIAAFWYRRGLCRSVESPARFLANPAAPGAADDLTE
jgi:hypothetical protein